MVMGGASDPFSSTSLGEAVFQSRSLNVLGLSDGVKIEAVEEVTTIRLTFELYGKIDKQMHVDMRKKMALTRS